MRPFGVEPSHQSIPLSVPPTPSHAPIGSRPHSARPCSFSRLFSSAPAPTSGSALKKAEPQPNMKYNAPGGLVKRSSTFSQFPTEKSKTLDFLNEE